MSPYPVQTDRETIVTTARHLIEQQGVDHLSLGKLAAALGIKAPSLYRHIANKNALLQAVVEQTFLGLFDAYDAALAEAGQGAVVQLGHLARAHRRFAHANPNCYTLAYATANPELPSNPNMLLERALAIQAIMQAISGEEDSLPALRGVLALAHGYVTLELNGQFRRGGDLAAHFDSAVAAYLQGWSTPKLQDPNR